MCQVGSPRKFGHQRDCHCYHSSCERATRMAHPWCATQPRSGRNAAGLQGKWTAERARALLMPANGKGRKCQGTSFSRCLPCRCSTCTPAIIYMITCCFLKWGYPKSPNVTMGFNTKSWSNSQCLQFFFWGEENMFVRWYPATMFVRSLILHLCR